MIKFNSIEEIKKYYNKNTNTYEFIDDGFLLDVKFTFDLEINGSIKAQDIKALDIKAYDIDAWDIKALDIGARNITYYAVCFAYQNIECLSIKGRRVNAKHFVLDGEIKKVIGKENKDE